MFDKSLGGQVKFFSLVLLSTLLASCSKATPAQVTEILCEQKAYDIGSNMVSIRLFGGERHTPISSREGEVSYGVHPVDAKYIEGDARFTINLMANDSFPECVITIDKLSGAAKQSCFGRPSKFPDDIRANSFEFNCKV